MPGLLISKITQVPTVPVLICRCAAWPADSPTRLTEPSLAGPKGRIVNIGSPGGKVGPPFLGGYAAAKHGVEGFSEGNYALDCTGQTLQKVGGL